MASVVCVNYAPALRRLVRKACTGYGVEFRSFDDIRAGKTAPIARLFLVHLHDASEPLRDLTRGLKSEFPSTPLIVTSISSDGTLAKWALRQRVSDYVALPYEIDYLTNCVRDWVNFLGACKGEKRRVIFDPEALSVARETFRAPSAASLRTQPAIDIIRKCFSEKLQPRTLATACKLSEEAFRRQFKLEHGGTLRSYLKTYRMGEALKMLEATELSVQEVAHLVGYDDPSTAVRPSSARMRESQNATPAHNLVLSGSGKVLLGSRPAAYHVGCGFSINRGRCCSLCRHSRQTWR